MRAWQLAGITVFTLLLAVFNGWQPFWILTYALFGALLFSIVWLWLSTTGLQFSRTASTPRAQVGDRIVENLALENHSIVPKLWVQVADGSTLPGHHAGYVSSIGPHQRIAWKARTLCERRGRFQLGPVTATTGDPLGMFKREIVFAKSYNLLVLPNVLPLATLDLFAGLMPGRGRGSQRSLQLTTNVVTVRSYVSGDALTRIHWPSTARQGKLMVKEFDLDPSIDVVLLVDLDRSVQAGDGNESTEEYAVTMAASIAAYLLRQRELAVGLHASGSKEPSLPLDRGERQIERILEALAIAESEERVPLAEALATEGSRLARNTVLIVITPSTALDWPEALSQLRQRGVRPVVIQMDPSTYEKGFGDSERVQRVLTDAGVPCIPVRQGDSLTQVLEEGPRPAGA